MSADPRFHVAEDPLYGVVLRCTDAELADQFEDFLSEKNFVFFSTKFQEAEALFYFGQAGSLDAVRSLVARFEADQRSTQ